MSLSHKPWGTLTPESGLSSFRGRWPDLAACTESSISKADGDPRRLLGTAKAVVGAVEQAVEAIEGILPRRNQELKREEPLGVYEEERAPIGVSIEMDDSFRPVDTPRIGPRVAPLAE
jgi:hypothetical protein